MGYDSFGAPVRLTRRQALALGALTAAGACRTTPVQPSPLPAQPNIVVYLADSLRSDRLGCYGYARPTSPALDRFSAESSLFERCYSASSWTKPSIASLFTGVLPRVHQSALSGAWKGPQGSVPVQLLRASFPTLASQLKAAGYHTAWFLSNPVVESQYGFARGMDYYRYAETEPTVDQAMSVMQWVRKEAKEPFFLFVHAIDPHYPYIAPDEAFDRLFRMSREAYIDAIGEPENRFFRSYVQERGSVFNQFDASRTSFQYLSPGGLAGLNGLYDAEVAYVDHQFGRILSTLRGKGYLDRSITVFTSDHGEAFGEHNFFYHAHAPFEHQVRVPLIIRLPGPPRPMRIPYSVSLCDLHTTLLHAGGAQAAPFVRAESLFDEDFGLAMHADRIVYADFDRNRPDVESWSSCMVRGGLKVMRTPFDGGVHAFDLIQDPGELYDLMMTDRGQSREIQRLIEQFLDEWARDRDLARAFGEPESIEEEELDREGLRALGYI